jgi:release factor glutamine methyltransferase
MNETELLFTELLNCPREELYLNKTRKLKAQEAGCLAEALRRRSRHEPVQYILGKTEFMGWEFRLIPDVFIPRPETEVLVETAISLTQEVRSWKLEAGSWRVLDIGTGSGCIAISLAKFLGNFNITATDISQQALNIAKENARIQNVENRITFIRSNLFESLPTCDMRYAICVCNPPYIPTAEIDSLEPELGFEPRIALDGGRDGLDFYRRIIYQAPVYLAPGGFLILEMGFNQCPAIKELFKSVKKLEIIEVIKDYNNIDRVIVARYG